MKQKAELEASFHILQSKKAAAAASAEAAVYEEAEENQSGEYSHTPHVLEQPVSTTQRTSEYIQQHSKLFFKESPSEDRPMELLKTSRQHEEMFNTGSAIHHSVHSNRHPGFGDTERKETIKKDPNEYLPEPQGAPDLARYLIRREMVSSGLLKFDDRPENYWSWKASFLSATKDLNLSDTEELDLMTKWLGTESSEQAKRIRSVHVLDPTAGRNMVWQRLEECYGTPEVIEHALLRKIEDFPKLTNKDNAKLRELCDLLLELESAKREGVLTGLSYLDTARGVNPIVEKLPYNLQEKWTAHGFKYKEDYRVAFPPFSLFSTFVQRQAKIRNDPCFTFTTSSSHVLSKTDKPEKCSNRASLSVHKTDVLPEHTDHQTGPAWKTVEDPDRQCPIHRKPHPLKKCPKL